MPHSREYPDRPMVGIGAVVWRGDQVLLIRRGKPPRVGQWSLPGGLQQLGETIAEAAIREVAEETGLRIAIGAVIGAYDSIERDAGGVRYHYTLVDVDADWLAGEAAAASDAAGVGWFRPEQLDGLGLWSDTLDAIRRSAARRNGSA